MMSSAITFQDVTWQDYPVHHMHARDSGDWTETTYELDTISSAWIGQKRLKRLFPYRTLSPFLDLDSSSVLPHFDVKRETSFIESKASDETILLEMMQNEIIFRMPPVSTFAVRVKVGKVGKAEPHVLKPEEV